MRTTRLVAWRRHAEFQPLRSLQSRKPPAAQTQLQGKPNVADDQDQPTTHDARLRDYLKASRASAVTLTFVDIEQLRGVPLPEIAYTQAAWWANNPAQPQAERGWLAAGWQTRLIDLDDRTITFSKRDR